MLQNSATAVSEVQQSKGGFTNESEKTAQKKKGKIFKYPAKIYAYCGSVYFAGFFYHWWNFIFYHAGGNVGDGSG